MSFAVYLLLFASSLAAANILPYYDFDFDDFISRYDQLIINDLASEDGTGPFYRSFEKALGFFDRSLDADGLKAAVAAMDTEGLKQYVAGIVECGERMGEDEVLDILFCPNGASLMFVSPTLDSPMSYFGHSFLIFYDDEAPFISPCINFFGDITASSGIRRVVDGLAGRLPSYYEIRPFYYHYIEYTARLDRSLILFPFIMDEDEKSRVASAVESLHDGSFPNYNFLFNNCTHGFFDALSKIYVDRKFPMDRALSPQTAVQVLREMGIIAEARLIFPAWMDMIDGSSPEPLRELYRKIHGAAIPGHAAAPFVNPEPSRPTRKTVSNRFSSLSLGYEAPRGVFSLSFEPVFNSFGEQNYVDHEVMDLKALGFSIAFAGTDFDRFVLDVFSFDSYLPITALKKRMSFSSSFSAGFQGKTFFVSGHLYAGISFGCSDALLSVGLDNGFSSYGWEYSLAARSLLFLRLGPVAIADRFDLMLYSTVYDSLRIENELKVCWRIVDSLSVEGFYIYDGEHRGGGNLVWHFNLF